MMVLLWLGRHGDGSEGRHGDGSGLDLTGLELSRGVVVTALRGSQSRLAEGTDSSSLDAVRPVGQEQ